ncbi:hypothetical protein V6U90_29370 [Micromonospora sp. CPCC 206060]|uniref:hypothetical protein n=1 Tax=Micromonospora sp. CPCC 206060 TaxID=3122406 RepID=UPI002FF10B05
MDTAGGRSGRDGRVRWGGSGRREHDSIRGGLIKPLSEVESNCVRKNAVWVVAQVLGYNDPNLDVYEFAEACGVDTRTPSGRPRSL